MKRQITRAITWEECQTIVSALESAIKHDKSALQRYKKQKPNKHALHWSEDHIKTMEYLLSEYLNIECDLSSPSDSELAYMVYNSKGISRREKETMERDLCNIASAEILNTINNQILS